MSDFRPYYCGGTACRGHAQPPGHVRCPDADMILADYRTEVEREVAAARNKGGVPNLWMICRDDGNYYSNTPNPKKLYASEANARHDAEQLARQSERPFYLLKVVAVVRTAKPPVEWTE